MYNFLYFQESACLSCSLGRNNSFTSPLSVLYTVDPVPIQVMYMSKAWILPSPLPLPLPLPQQTATATATATINTIATAIATAIATVTAPSMYTCSSGEASSPAASALFT